MVFKDVWEGFPDRADTSAVDLVLYISETVADPGRQLQEVLDDALPDIRLELFTGFEELVTGLKRPEAEPAVMVLVLGHRAELEEFLPLRPELANTRVILVLPDESRETLSLAQRLSPHYVCAVGADFVEVATIIDEILKERRVSSSGVENLPPNHNL
jgi:hypothetical protein